MLAKNIAKLINCQNIRNDSRDALEFTTNSKISNINLSSKTSAGHPMLASVNIGVKTLKLLLKVSQKAADYLIQ